MLNLNQYQKGNLEVVNNFLSYKKERIIQSFKPFTLEEIKNYNHSNNRNDYKDLKRRLKEEESNFKSCKKLLISLACNSVKDNYNARVGSGNGFEFKNLKDYSVHDINDMLKDILLKQKNIIDCTNYTDKYFVFYDTGFRGLGGYSYGITMIKKEDIDKPFTKHVTFN